MRRVAGSWSAASEQITRGMEFKASHSVLLFRRGWLCLKGATKGEGRRSRARGHSSHGTGAWRDGEGLGTNTTEKHFEELKQGLKFNFHMRYILLYTIRDVRL
jgi:hypothetical protein